MLPFSTMFTFCWINNTPCKHHGTAPSLVSNTFVSPLLWRPPLKQVKRAHLPFRRKVLPIAARNGMNPQLSLWKDLGKVKVVSPRVKSPFWWRSGTQQLEASHIDRLNRQEAHSKQNSWGLTSLAFAQLDPGRPRGPPYFHSVYSDRFVGMGIIMGIIIIMIIIIIIIIKVSLAEVQIPCRTAIRAHLLVIKVLEKFYLISVTMYFIDPIPISWIGSQRTVVKADETLKYMKQKFQPKLLKDIPKKPSSKSLDFRVRFGVINSASKTKDYLSKNSTNRLRIKNKQVLKLLVPKSGSFYFSGNSFCQLPIFQLLLGHVENIPFVLIPLPSRSSSFSFLIYLSLQDGFSQAHTSF